MGALQLLSGALFGFAALGCAFFVFDYTIVRRTTTPAAIGTPNHIPIFRIPHNHDNDGSQQLSSNLSAVIPPIATQAHQEPDQVQDQKLAGHQADGTATSSSSIWAHHFPYPQPSDDVFVTSVSNHGAGLGHQFGEWMFGPYLGMITNITYVYSGFLMNSQRWNAFLGWGAQEHTPEDLRNMENLHTFSVSADYPRSMNDASNWFESRVQEFRNAKKSGKFSNDSKALFQLFRVHVPDHKYVCNPQLNLMLRQKYCLARIRHPLAMKDNIYADDRANGRMVIAIHLRCGDSCRNPGRATSFPSVNRTMHRMYELLSPLYGKDKIAFHVFSQLPRDDNNWFQPLLDMIQDLSVKTHFQMHSGPTLHNLAVADVLLGAQSSFSWVASILHNSIMLGPVPACRFAVTYNREDGTFDEILFLKYVNESKPFVPKFDNLQDCYNYRKLDPIPT